MFYMNIFLLHKQCAKYIDVIHFFDLGLTEEEQCVLLYMNKLNLFRLWGFRVHNVHGNHGLLGLFDHRYIQDSFLIDSGIFSSGNIKLVF